MLRFHSLPGGEPAPLFYRREELANGSLPLVHGRRLASGGILAGALHTIGYYATDVCVGSPPRRYELIIDTGSSLTAVPCASCRTCGDHACGKAGRFDLRASSTVVPVTCPLDGKRHPGVKCDQCVSSQCSYAVHYTEGSSIRGQIVKVFSTPRHPQSSLQIAPRSCLSLCRRASASRTSNCTCACDRVAVTSARARAAGPRSLPGGGGRRERLAGHRSRLFRPPRPSGGARLSSPMADEHQRLEW